MTFVIINEYLYQENGIEIVKDLEEELGQKLIRRKPRRLRDKFHRQSSVYFENFESGIFHDNLTVAFIRSQYSHCHLIPTSSYDNINYSSNTSGPLVNHSSVYYYDDRSWY